MKKTSVIAAIPHLSFRPELQEFRKERSGEIWELYNREISPLRPSTGCGRNDNKNSSEGLL
ncbi:MAG: hypothetical protein AB7J46_06960 [Candidatus Altimarinota bacterium]